MKKWAAIMGLVLLLTGFVVISSWKKPQVQTNSRSNYVEDSWSISDNFTKGHNITVDFQQSYDWSLDPYDDPPDDPPYHRKHLSVSVTDTIAKTTTVIRVTLVGPRGVLPPALYTSRLEVFPPVNVTQHGATIVEDNPKVDPEHGINLGQAKNDGLYTITLSFEPRFTSVWDKDTSGKLWIHETFPPTMFRAHEVSTQTDYPYTFLLPVGASLGVVGIILAVWGARSSERKSIRKARPR